MELCIGDENFQQTNGEAFFDEMMQMQGQIYRQVANRKVVRFTRNGQAYFVKLHFGVGWLEIIKELLQGRVAVLGAKQEFAAIQTLQACGIDTLPFVAFGRRGNNPATQQSFLVTREITEVTSLEDLTRDWASVPPSVTFKRELIKRVAEISRIMHQKGMNHRDFYICHFLLDHSQRDKINKLYLIDLHRMQIRSRVPTRWLVKDLGSLYFSVLDIGLTRSDIFRFLKYYYNKPLREILVQHGALFEAVNERAQQLNKKAYRKGIK